MSYQTKPVKVEVLYLPYENVVQLMARVPQIIEWYIKNREDLKSDDHEARITVDLKKRHIVIEHKSYGMVVKPGEYLVWHPIKGHLSIFSEEQFKKEFDYIPDPSDHPMLERLAERKFKIQRADGEDV